jgi:hypothetical protein
MSVRSTGLVAAVALLFAGCAHHRPRGPVAKPAPAVDPRQAANESRHLFAARFVDDWLGLESIVPDGFEARVDFGDALLSMRTQSGMAVLMFEPRVFDETFADRFATETAEVIGSGVGAVVVDDDLKPEDLEWGSGYVRHWHNAEVRVTVAIGPLCDGRWTMAAVTLERSGTQVLTDQRWTHRIAHAKRAPGCTAAVLPPGAPK